MSDWADEKAMALFREYGDDVGVMDVAAALRAARNEALEEAAKAAEKSVTPNCDCSDCTLLMGIADDIRALKDKQP